MHVIPMQGCLSTVIKVVSINILLLVENKTIGWVGLGMFYTTRQITCSYMHACRK